jgi:prophage regulatory protein
MSVIKPIYRRKDLQARVNLSLATIYRMIDRGEFPAPIKLGIKAVGWTEETITAWVQGRSAIQGS